MRKIILLTFLVIGTGVCQAQFSKGTKYVGLNAGYNGRHNERLDGNFVKHSSLTAVPNIGLYVFENLSVGLNVGYLRRNYESYSSYLGGYSLLKDLQSTFNVLASVRKVYPISSKWSCYTEIESGVGIGFYRRIDKEEDYIEEGYELDISRAQSKSFHVGGSFGATYLISDQLGLEATLVGFRYNVSKLDLDSEDLHYVNRLTKDFNLDLAFDRVQLGIKYYF